MNERRRQPEGNLVRRRRPGRRARRGAAAAWLAAAALAAGLLAAGGGVAHSQGGAPVIQVLESGHPLADGSWFNRAVTPVVQTSGGQAPVTATALLDGAAWTSGTAVSAAGAHQLAVTAVDAAGTAATPVTLGFTIKTAPPVFGPLTPASGTITAATQVTVTGTVDSAVSVTVAGQASTLVGGQSFSAGPIALTEGANNLSVTAQDAAGNSASASLVVVRDTMPPAVAISQPAAGAVVGTAAVDVVGSVSDPHLASVTVNGTVASVTGSVFRAAQVPLAEGSNSLTAVAVDQAGNRAQATAAVVRDTTPPTLQITSPADGTVVPGATITVSGVASDAHLDRVLVGGAPAALAAAAGGAAVTWSLPVALQAGSNTIAVQAVDKVGNSTAASITVVRDSSVPQVHIDQPVDGARLNTATAAVSGSVQQKDGMVVTVNGATAAVNGAAFSLAGVALAEGQNRLVARATDPAGNQGVHSILVYRDTVPPQLASADPAAGAQSIPVGTAFRLTFSEAMAAPAAGSWSLQTAAGQAIAAGATLSGSTLTVQPATVLPAAAAVRLVLTAALTDLAGNALANPQTLSYTTLDTAAPAAPVVAAVPAYLCADSVTLTGTAAAGSVIDVAGGAAAAETRADAGTGQFSVAVLLTPGSINRLLVTATAPSTGAVSVPAAVQVVQDCQAPYVISAQVSGGVVKVTFDKPVKPASVVGAVGAVTVTGPGGPVAGTVTLSADGRTATFTPTPAGTPLPGGVLRLDVSTAVQDVAGNALAYPYTQLFGTGAGGGTSFLAGTAIDNGIGRPLAGVQALVALTNGAPPPAPAPEQVTGGDGSFRVTVPAGTHQLWFSRQGYTPVYRVVTVGAAQGASVFAPRLTPAAGAQSVGPAGGTVVGTPPGGAGAAGAGSGSGGGSAGGAGGGAAAAPSLAIPGGALQAPAAVSLTGLDEQGLPAQLPFGWSPRGAAWLDLGGAALAGTATLTLPVEAPEGAPLVVVRLDAAALQWRVVAAGVPVAGGVVTAALSGGAAGGGYAAVDPDTGAEAPSVPAAAVAGAVLPSAQGPAGTEVSAATLTFNPATVLPAQTSLATALYTVAAGGVASGMPLTLSVAEQLTLLDGTTRKQPPYPADLVLYHAADGTARSRFRLAPSQQAQELPLSLGSEAVGLRLYAGAAAQGNVVGPSGGTFTSGDGDRVDVPPGALAQATPVALSRVAAGDLPLAAPAGTVLDGALRLDLAGQPLLAPVTLTLALPAAPAAGDRGLLLEATDFGSGPVLRPVAALQAAGAAWTTAPIVAADLPWPGVIEGGVFLFVRLAGPTGYLHGAVTGPGAGTAPPGPVSGALVTGAGLGWTQASAADGSYVLPAPAGTVAVAALDPATGNSAAASAAVPAADARVRLDLVLQVLPLAVTATAPADGATGVLPGIQPTVTFNRPVDPSTVTGSAGGVQLLQGGQAVPADVTVQGATVQLVPRASLLQGTVYQLQATTAVRDRYGNSLPAAVSAGFTTQTIVLPSSFDMTKVFLIEPDAGGMAAVVGQPGALPAGALVFLENTTALASTTSVTVAQDGSFSLSIHASLTDKLLLHVLVSGQNEVQTPLGPFHSADLASALVDAGGAVFHTGAGVTVSVPAGAFAAPTRVRVTPHAPIDPPAAPVPAGFSGVYAFALDFSNYADGSPLDAAAAPLEVTVPAPAGAVADAVYFLDREVEPFGQHLWMLMDLMSFDAAHHQLTTADAAVTRRAALSQAAERRAAVKAAAAAGATRPPAADTPAPAPGPLTRIANRDQAKPAKLYLPGSAFPGQYQIQAPQIPIGWYTFPISFDANVAMYNTALDGMATVINAATARLLSYDAVLIPTRLNHTATITVRDLSTGYVLASHTFDPPADSTPVVVPPEALADHKPPLPIGGSPLQLFLLDPSSKPQKDLAAGITMQAANGQMTITAPAGSLQPNVDVRLVGVDDSVSAQAKADATGAFTLQQSYGSGKRYVLALGAVLTSGQPLELDFTKGLDSAFTGVSVRDPQGTQVAPHIAVGDLPGSVIVTPLVAWSAGQTYTLHLGAELNDGLGDAWGKTLDLPFQIEKSQVVNTLQMPTAYDIAVMGSMMFVAAGSQGLVVLDASNPAKLANIIPGSVNVSFPFPLNDPVRGVAVDPHGRVIEVGGGVTGFGQLKFFDPTRLNVAGLAANPTDPALLGAPFRGGTILSDNLSGGTGTQLPEGTPRRVSVLSNDISAAWFAGDPPPAGLTLNPTAPPNPLPATGEYSLTVAGTGVTKNRPVTLFDRTLGRFQRADAAADGTFSIVLSVRPGDALELLENVNSLAYVATLGVGIEVVSLDTVYNKVPDPSHPGVLSDVIGIYSGFGDPALLLCGAPVSDLAGTVTQIGTLFDPTNAHPMVAAALVGNNGVVLLDSPVATPGNLSFLTDICANFKGSNAVTGMAVVQRYAFDFNGDGKLAPSEQRDYILVTHRTAGVLVYDVTDRANPKLVGQIPLPGDAADIAVDTANRRLYVSGYGGGLYVVDFNRPPSIGLLDQNQNGTDDRVIETITLPGNTDAPVFVAPGLGVAYAGGIGRGVTSLAVGGPLLTAVANNLQAGPNGKPPGGIRQVAALAPFGVPTVVEGDNQQNRPGLIRIQAGLPGGLGTQVKLDVVSLGPTGQPIAPAGDSSAIQDLPRASLDGPDNGVKFTRLADQPYQEGYNLYLSEPIAVLADLKASQAYVRSKDEKQACTRCDQTAEKAPANPKPRELLSGDSLAVRFPQALRAQVAALYTADQLGESQLVVPSTRWERTPSPYGEPIQNALPQQGVMPHSGELTSSSVDIRIPSRGMDFVLARSYRGQDVGDGPFGPGWDHNFNQRLRELPNGDVELYDGTPRRVVFQKCKADDAQCKAPAKSGQAGQYQSPAGVFSTLQKTVQGFLLLDPRHDLIRFDRHGRMLSIADAIKQDDSTGSQITLNYDIHGRLDSITDTVGRPITFTYDSHGHITQIEDFDGRDFTYKYDDRGRLTSFSLPPALIALASGPTLTTTSDPITVTYAYDTTTGDLATTLTSRGKLTSVTDGRSQTWLQVSYADSHGSGHATDVQNETLSAGVVNFDYSFDQHTTGITDPLGNRVQFGTNQAGQVAMIADPAPDSSTVQYTYDEEGLVASRTDPLGRVTTYAYDSPCTPPTMTLPQNAPIGDRRSRGDLTMVAVQPDGRGVNGSGGALVTCTGYDAVTNQPIRIVDPRGSVTIITRDGSGLPVSVMRAAGAPEATLTQASFNPYGQPVLEVNPNGHVTAYQYNGLGYLQKVVVDATGLNLTTVYGTDDRGNVLTMTDPRGVLHQRTYNALDWITSSTRAASASADGAPALGFVTSYLYDANHNLVEEQLPFGDGSRYTRVRRVYGPLDELLIVAREVQPGDPYSAWSQTTYVYDQNLNLTQTIEPDGQHTVVTFDQRNLPAGRTRGAGSPAAVHDTFQYDLDRQLIQYIDGRGGSWRTYYDGYGRVARTVDPLGNHADTTYDNDGNPIGAQAFGALATTPPSDALLAQRAAAYDLLGRRISLTSKLLQLPGQPANAHDLTTALQYDPGSNLVAVVDPLLRTTRFVYDGGERKIATVDAAGNRLEHDLDAGGNAVTTRSIEQSGGAGGQAGTVTVTTHATYDALDRLASTSDGLGNLWSFSYDARNNLVLSADPEQSLTTQSWDGLDRLVEKVLPEGVKVDYAYDLSSRLTGYTDALGNQTAYAYDALNRRVQATYPDRTTESTVYDAGGNPQAVTDANGTIVQQQFDAANRLVGRQASGPNLVGASSETYAYDGLHRLLHAQSGNQSTDLAFDSLSRRVQEVVGGKTVTYAFDDGGNETAIGYPSGFVAARTFDPLDRLSAVRQASAPQSAIASFGFRGPDLVASKTLGNGLTGVRQFDAAKRQIDDWFQVTVGGGQQTVFRESLAWSPRSLKAGQARGDLAGEGLLFAYDGAERLVKAAKSPAPLIAVANNHVLKPSDLAGMADAFAYTYDAAQNLLAKADSANGVQVTTALPLDASGRNRPGAANGVALQWDRNGNLIQKGSLNFHYDFRNRLTQVTDASNGNAEIARYEYDAFNRRIAKTAGAASRQTVWQGWRPIEDYDTSATTPRLLARRTYGAGLDEILYLESDLDGSGNVAAKSWPLYDASGNLALLANAAGLPLERYDYTPYGSQTISVNTGRPVVQQVRTVGNALWIELSEGVQAAPLAQAVATQALSLVDTTRTPAIPVANLAVAQPVLAGNEAGRRLVLTGSMGVGGDSYTLTIPPQALQDVFLNQPAQPYTLSFTWPQSGDAVLADLAAPTVQRLTLRQGALELELSAEPNLAAATAAIQLDGAALAWTLGADHYTLVSTTQVPAGAHTLAVAATLTDLGGRPLAAAFSQSFTAASQDTRTVFAAPDPHTSSASAVGNLFGYQGMPRDPETGLIYFRNRYYDPELGRFITVDPKGYTDGPSMYGFEKNDPANGSDPLGFGVDQIPVVGPTVAGAEEVGESAGDLGVASSAMDSCTQSGKSDATDVEEMQTMQDQQSVNDRGQYGPGRRCLGKATRKTGSAAVHAAKAGGYALDAATEFQIYRDALRAAIAAGKAELEAVKIAREAVAKAKKDAEARAAKKAAEKGLPRDFVTRNTKNWSSWFRSEGEARAFARTKLGSNPVEIEAGKWRSRDGRWQYRAYGDDLKERHIHLEQLNPETGEVIQNLHLRWPEEGGR